MNTSGKKNNRPRTQLLHIKRKPLGCLLIDCSHKAARKRKCQRKRCSGESLITAESRWAASMQGQQLWSLREVSAKEVTECAESAAAAPRLISSRRGFITGEKLCGLPKTLIRTYTQRQSMYIDFNQYRLNLLAQSTCSAVFQLNTVQWEG